MKSRESVGKMEEERSEKERRRKKRVGEEKEEISEQKSRQKNVNVKEGSCGRG